MPTVDFRLEGQDNTGAAAASAISNMTQLKTAIDSLNGAAKESLVSVRAFASSFTRISSASSKAATSISTITSSMTGVNTVANSMAAPAKEAAGSVNKIAAAFKKTSTNSQEAGSTVGSSLGQIVSGLESIVAPGLSVFDLVVGGLLTGIIEKGAEVLMQDVFGGIAHGLEDITKAGIESNSQFETFTNRFDILLGSMGQAKTRMQELQQVGLNSPFELKDIVAADVQLTNFGLDTAQTSQLIGKSGSDIRNTILETAAAITTSSDTAGSTLVQLTDNIGKFETTGSGTYIRALERMGVVTQAQLVSMGMEFDAHNHIVNSSTEAINILLDTMAAKYKGTSELAMGSMNGLKSNIADVFGFVERTLTVNIFDGIKSALLELHTILVDPESEAAFQSINDSIGSLMVSAKEFFGSVENNGGKVPGILTKIADAFADLANWVRATEEVSGNFKDNFFTPLLTLAKEMYTFGQDVVTQFAQGISDGIGYVESAVMSVADGVTYLLQSNSPPKAIPKIKQMGQDAIQQFAEGLNQPDLSILMSIGPQIQSIMTSMFESLNLDKSKLIPAFLGTEKDVAEALSQFEKIGSISQSLRDKIKADAGESGDRVLKLFDAEISIVGATKEVATAQKTVDDATKNVALATKDVAAAQELVVSATKKVVEAQKEVSDVNDKIKQDNENFAAALGNLNDILKSQEDAYKKIKTAGDEQLESMQAGIELINGKLDDTKSALDAVKQGVEDATAEWTNANQVIDAQLSINKLLKEEADLRDQINGTGKYGNVIKKDELAVQQDQTRAQLEANNYQIQHSDMEAKINSGKLTGLALQNEKLKLQDLEIQHAQNIANDQDKLANDQAKLADDSSGKNKAEAELKLQKDLNQEKIDAVKNDPATKQKEEDLKDQEKLLQGQKKVAEEDVKNFKASLKEKEGDQQKLIDQTHESINRTQDAKKSVDNEDKQLLKTAEEHVKIAKEGVTAAQDHVAEEKKKEEAAKAVLATAKDGLTVAKDHLNTAKEHLKILEDQNKLYESNMKLAEQQAKLEADNTNKAAAAYKAAHKPPPHHKKPPPPPRQFVPYVAPKKDQKAAGATSGNNPFAHGDDAGGGPGAVGKAIDHSPFAKINGFITEVKEHIQSLKDKWGEVVTLFNDSKSKIEELGPAFNDILTAIRPFVDDLGYAKDHFRELSPYIAEVKTNLSPVVDTLGYAKDHLKDLGPAVTTVSNDLGYMKDHAKDLGPPLAGIVDGLTKFGDIMASGVKPVLADMMPHLTHVGDTLSKWVDKILPQLGPMWDSVSSSLNNLKPLLILLAIPIASFTANIEGWVAAFDKALPDILQVVQGFVHGITDYLKLLSDLFSGVGTFVKDIFAGDIDKAWKDIQDTTDKVTTDIWHVIKDTWDVISGVFKVVFDLITGYVGGFTSGLWDFFKGLSDNVGGPNGTVSTMMNAISSTFQIFITETTRIFGGWIDGIKGFFQGLSDDLVGHSIVPDMITMIQNAFTGMVNTVTTTVAGWVKSAKDEIQKLSDDVVGAAGILTVMTARVASSAEAMGSGIVAGIKSGIASVWQEFINDWNSKVDEIPGGIGKKLEIHSPSQVIADLTKWVPMGAAKGIDDNMDSLRAATDRMVVAATPSKDRLLEAFSPTNLTAMQISNPSGGSVANPVASGMSIGTQQNYYLNFSGNNFYGTDQTEYEKMFRSILPQGAY